MKVTAYAHRIYSKGRPGDGESSLESYVTIASDAHPTLLHPQWSECIDQETADSYQEAWDILYQRLNL